MQEVHTSVVFAANHPFVEYFYVSSLGNVKTISGQFKKSELCAEHRLNVS